MQKRSNDVPPGFRLRLSTQSGRQPRAMGKCLNQYVLVLDYGMGRSQMLAAAIDFFGWDQITRIDRGEGLTLSTRSIDRVIERPTWAAQPFIMRN